MSLALLGCGGNGQPTNQPPLTWKLQSSGTSQPLYDIACLTTLKCEAVGAGGTIVATSNAGDTWHAQANPLDGSPAALYRIACVAPSSCYVIARPDTILVTHDGGATWSSHSLGLGLQTGAALTDSACLPDYTPIAGRPELCRLGLLDIACTSATECQAVATTPAAYGTTLVGTAATPASSVWSTRNGGASWTSQPVPAGVACNADCDQSLDPYPLVWIACTSAGTCFAGGEHVLGCGHCGFAGVVLSSTGSGTWRCVEATITCTTFGPDAADCPTRSVCYGVEDTNPFGSDTDVARTSDGGRHWTSIGPNWAQVLSDVGCANALTCYVVGSGGAIISITNGTTMTAQVSPTRVDLSAVVCSGTAVCFAVGDGGSILAGS
jgi:photosystem II stability/assembly factor-like uncharacterized protein